MRSKNLKLIDLFAGIGGIRLGFQDFFGECVFASEWDKYAQRTYEANFKHKPSGDINEINLNEIPYFDILLAGFPCQPFSMAGLKKGFNDTRANSFFKILEIIRHHKPKIIFLENVKGLTFHNHGESFKLIIESLKDQGYYIYYKILNAKDFGLPQNRERIYIVGFLDNLEFEFPKASNLNTKVNDILDGVVEKKYTISDRIWAGHQRRKIENNKKGNGFGYCIVNRDSTYTRTITARYGADGSEILIEQKGENPRKLTPREAARLQGFPDTFVFPISDTQAYRQIGNSVAVPVVRSIAKQINLTIEKNHA